MAFARRHLLKDTHWEAVVSSDEKKFRWDGPDGLHSFWYQPNEPLPLVPFSKDFHQYRGVMVWGCVSSKGLIWVERMRESVTAESYSLMLCGNALAQIHSLHGTDFILQQDNATPHRASFTSEYFTEAGLNVMQWPAMSPDLNPMENVWSMLVRLVYAEGRFYESDDALWDGIRAAAARITLQQVQPLIASMRERLVNVLSRAGQYAQ
jgi:hypothetical protein